MSAPLPVQDEGIQGVTPAELQTLCAVVGVPPLAGLGVLPLDDLDEDTRIAAMAQAMESLASRGFVERVGADEFRVTPTVSQLVIAAGRPAAVMRLVETGDPEGVRLLFVYGIHELAVVHVIEHDGTQRLFPKTLEDVLVEVGALLESHAHGDLDEGVGFRLRRSELMSGASTDPGAAAVAEAAASGVAIRADLAWMHDGAPIEPYLAVVGRDDQERWLVTGLGESPESNVTAHRAAAGAVREAFLEMLSGSVFAIAASA